MHEFRAEEGYARDVKREEGGAYGVLGVILGLILVSGKTLGEGASYSSLHGAEPSNAADPSTTADQLVVYLKKLGLNLNKSIPASLAARPTKEGGVSLQKYLTTLASQGYLEKSKAGTGALAATQASKSQQNGGAGGDPSVEWKWGARAESEFGEAGIARFVKEIYESKGPGERDDDEEGGEDVDVDVVNGKEKLLTEIGRASGSANLAEATAVKGLETA